MSATPSPEAERAEEQVQPFVLESSGIRGRLLRLGPAVDQILSQHAYPEPVARTLGEMLALTAALGSLLKYEGVFSLQVQGDGPLSLAVVDVTSAGHLRGYASFDQERLARLDPGAIRIPALLGKGRIAFTVDQGPDTDRYQGIVEILGDTLADCIQHYFLQSEQVQSGISLAAAKAGGHWRATALILQRLPDEEGDRFSRDLSAAASSVEEDDWRRAMIFQASCGPAELLDPALSDHDLLYRLFHQEGVRVFEPRPVIARCRCSRERIVAVLASLPREEVAAMKEEGQALVTCEFCNRKYHFTESDLDAILAT